MKTKIRNYFLKRFIKQNRIQQRKYLNYNDIKTVLILFESEFNEKNKNIKDIISKLTDDKKDVDAIGYIDKKEILTSVRSNFRILGKKHINWFEKPCDVVLKKVKNKKYDLLIDLNINNQIPLLYLNVASNSLLKTGLYNKKYDLFDFSIHKKKLLRDKKELEIINIFQQITFYLKKIEAK
ncbi:MAG: hypothetical protein CR965_01630 [Paludibacter sp.]|nr:MAG: hypothetical protein CR965_01630 [Paludibacter sp.]